MSERATVAIEALHRIAEYRHTDECTSCAPVHECGCQEMSEQEIAIEALKQIEGDDDAD